MTKYHVTQQWDGKDLESASQRMGEEEAIEMFMKKWMCDDSSFAADQVTKIYVYATLSEAQAHQDSYDGEILEIDDTYLELREDWSEGILNFYSNTPISADDVKRI